MKYRIIQVFFSILLLLVFAADGFANKIEIEKDKSNKKKISSDSKLKVIPIEQMVDEKNKLNQTALSSNAGEQINWLIISSGGVRGTSTDLVLSNTIGQSAVVLGTTTDYQLNAGFWQNFTTNPQGCCIGYRGNINGGPDDGTLINSVDIVDLVFLVDFMFRDGPEITCYDEANVGGGEGIIDIVELVYLVDYMFRDGPLPLMCP